MISSSEDFVQGVQELADKVHIDLADNITGATAKRKTYENNLNTEPKYLCEHCNESFFKVVDMENLDDLKIQISNLNTAHTCENCNESYFGGGELTGHKEGKEVEEQTPEPEPETVPPEPVAEPPTPPLPNASLSVTTDLKRDE